MAGGLFGRPFVFNEKCIIFSILCMLLFLYKPTFRNQYTLYFTLFIIFVIAYVAMAWYDYYFDCTIVPLKRGKNSITGQFKPPTHETEKQEDTSDDHGENTVDAKRTRILIYLLHILLIVPLLLYIAHFKTKCNKIVYPIIGVLAIFTAGYHAGFLMMSAH